jgi:hypothetical protein
MGRHRATTGLQSQAQGNTCGRPRTRTPTRLRASLLRARIFLLTDRILPRTPRC